MKKTKQQLEKITKYSIRKLTVGVGPVAIGAFLFGASTLSVCLLYTSKGQAVADFELTGVDGKTYRLSDYKGKKVYLKFWASWCSICLASLPDTDEIAKEAGDDLSLIHI